MFQWGDSYAGDKSWMDLKVGDNVRVKHSGLTGELILITPNGDYLVDHGATKMAYDGDMLIKIKDVKKEGK